MPNSEESLYMDKKTNLTTNSIVNIYNYHLEGTQANVVQLEVIFSLTVNWTFWCQNSCRIINFHCNLRVFSFLQVRNGLVWFI